MDVSVCIVSMRIFEEYMLVGNEKNTRIGIGGGMELTFISSEDGELWKYRIASGSGW